MQKFTMKHGYKIIFIGDSITDCDRRGQQAPYGDGYVKMLRTLIITEWPDLDIQWVNKGVSGNSIIDQQTRWEDDVIREQPDWLSILIGINDLHGYLNNQSDGISPTRYRAVYEEILDRTIQKTHAKIFLGTPFYMSIDQSFDSTRSQVLRILPEYIAVVAQLAAQYDACVIGLHTLFQKQLTFRNADEVAYEPVHPNAVGHLMIAQRIFKTFNEQTTYFSSIDLTEETRIVDE
jgi:lysophospholipase L1-like esterase